MPFFKPDDIENFDAYKKARNASLSRIGEKPLTFVYSKKYTFSQPQKKVSPIFIFENGRIDPNIIKTVKAGAAGPIAEGSCYKNKDDVLIFELTKGDLDGFDMVPKFQIGESEDKSEKTEADKTAAPAEAAAAQAEAAEEEEESQDLKVRLINSLKKIRTADGKEAIAFVACVAKPFYGVLFAKNATEKIGATHKKTLTDLTQGTKFIIGTCIFENNAHTFVVDPVPGGLAKKLKLALKEFTGLACKVRVRDAESKVVADGETDIDPDEAQPQAAAAPAQAAQEALAAFKERLKALQPEILKAIGAKTPQGDEIKKHAAEAGAQAGKSDFAQANKVLDLVESLLKKVASAVSPKATGAADAAGEGQPRDIKLSTYLSGRKNLRTARESAEKELKRLQEAILAKCKDEPFYGEVESKSQKLMDFLAPIDDSVADKLDEAGRCTDPEQQQELNKKVRELIQKQLAGMRSHPLASFIEKNPFGKFVIKQPIEVTLSALDKQLA